MGKPNISIGSWMASYQRSYLAGDLTAGLTVGIMLIPQGMAYALIAGLPPVYGLYTALIPQVIYAIFGSSRHLAIGPVAMDSLLVAASISTLASVGTQHYITLAILLAFIIGSIQVCMGLFQLGFLVNFLSKPVISGFTSAAALIIGLNQLKYLLGVYIPRDSNVLNILQSAVQQISNFNSLSIIIGLLGIAVIISLRRIHKMIPGALVVVVAGILVVHGLDLEHHGVSIVGDVPAGLPAFQVPSLHMTNIKDLLPAAFTIAFLSFMEAISIAKAVQAKHRTEYQLRPNQELLALGLGNIIGSFFGTYPATGGFSRTAVNEQSGAKTNLSSLVAAVVIALTLLFLTPLFYDLPKAILASIIMVAVFRLIDIRFPYYLWQTRKEDFLMLLVAFGVTLAIGIKEGIIISVVMSLMGMIYRSVKPHVAVLGFNEKDRIYRNTERYNNLIIRPEILIFRYDAELYFANSNHFAETVRQEALKKGSRLKCIILKANSIAHIDSTGYQVLEEIVEDFNSKGIKVLITNLIGPVRDFLERAGIDDLSADQLTFMDVQAAIDYFDKSIKSPSGTL